MFRTASPSARRQGVTLIEVVIAIFVLSVGILGIMALFPTGYRLTRKAVDRGIGAMAARHAQARIYGMIKSIVAPNTELDATGKPKYEPLYAVPDGRRVGRVTGVAANQLTCTVPAGKPRPPLEPDPEWTTLAPDGLTGYFIVMTSGSADGHIYLITGNGNDTLTTTARFNTVVAGVPEKQYEPVRVGDTFALIGIKGGYPSPPQPTRCFPDKFLGDDLNPVADPAKGANPENNETRTMPVATYGDPKQTKDLWRYSYGCILTVPPPEFKDTCRLDIFIYSGFPYRAGANGADGTPPATTYPDPSVVNAAVIGHYVTYMSAGHH